MLRKIPKFQTFELMPECTAKITLSIVAAIGNSQQILVINADSTIHSDTGKRFRI